MPLLLFGGGGPSSPSSAGGTNIYVETTVDAGHSWTSADWPRALVGVCDSDAIPTLAVDRWGNLYCWFHRSGAAVGYLSTDYGQTWTQYATQAGKWPRLRIALGRSYLVCWDGENLHLFGSDDYGVTLDAAPILLQSAPAQLAALAEDRRGDLHLYFESGTSLYRVRWDGKTLDGPTSMATNLTRPALAFDLPQGDLLAWGAPGLCWKLTDSAYDVLERTGIVGASAPEQTVGVAVDRRGIAWLVAQVTPGADAGIEVRYSVEGDVWLVPP